jgi:hypothetical protein
LPGISQEITGGSDRLSVLLDSLRKAGFILNENQKTPEIKLSTAQAIEFLQNKYLQQYWKNPDDPLRFAIGQLIYEASYPPYDSSEYFLKRYPFDSISIPWDKFYILEPLKLKVPGVNVEVGSESPAFPFRYYKYPFQGDSIRAAVEMLMDFVEARDSGMINITGTGGVVTHVWLNSRSDMMKRYWLRNEMDDSVTVWIGTPSRNTIGLYLEQGVNFRRPAKQGYYSDARVEVREVDKSKLLDVKVVPPRSQYWKFRSETSFALNQGAVSNWVKGGESSISVSTDITGFADYLNKDSKLSSNNFARIKFGLIKSGDNGIRKNLDLLETNSKINHKAFGKFDFSGILLFKTQVAKGHSYTKTDTTLVSKFFNPVIITAGFGLDYKPNKNTSINFSPLSYKGTFVTDTTGIKGINAIDQTKYGIQPGKLSKNEPGMSFMITNEFRPVKTVTITNRLQLFTNYINNPQNIDIDWEMIMTAALNWFTDVRFNTHLIFDDDTKTPVFDKEKLPVMDPVTGKQKTTARIQFKELLGFSFIFRF